ncbi:MAG: 50S ribosomal protein L22 [Clostridiales bacterium]|nr:50S ribosomal protein L22 [Candidatus Apopatousia equi]
MAKRMREKSARIAENRDKRPHATASYVRMASLKAGKILDLIRGKKYFEAVAILENTPHYASPVILKVLNSAAANAENNLSMNKEDLFVAECYANEGPLLKRMMPRAKGRGDRILKRTAHITVVLDTNK